MKETEILRGLHKAKHYANGTAFVKGQQGRDKVPARLTHGEAVLPVDTVKAVGSNNLARLIADTNNGKAPHRGLRSGGHYVDGTVPDDQNRTLDPTIASDTATQVGAGVVGAAGVGAAINSLTPKPTPAAPEPVPSANPAGQFGVPEGRSIPASPTSTSIPFEHVPVEAPVAPEAPGLSLVPKDTIPYEKVDVPKTLSANSVRTPAPQATPWTAPDTAAMEPVSFGDNSHLGPSPAVEADLASQEAARAARTAAPTSTPSSAPEPAPTSTPASAPEPAPAATLRSANGAAPAATLRSANGAAPNAADVPTAQNARAAGNLTPEAAEYAQATGLDTNYPDGSRSTVGEQQLRSGRPTPGAPAIADVEIPPAGQAVAPGVQTRTQRLATGAKNMAGKVADGVRSVLPGQTPAPPAPAATPTTASAVPSGNPSAKPSTWSTAPAEAPAEAPKTPLTLRGAAGKALGYGGALIHGAEAAQAFNKGDPYALAGHGLVGALEAVPGLQGLVGTADLAGTAAGAAGYGDGLGGTVARSMRAADQFMADKFGNERAKLRLAMGGSEAAAQPAAPQTPAPKAQPDAATQPVATAPVSNPRFSEMAPGEVNTLRNQMVNGGTPVQPNDGGFVINNSTGRGLRINPRPQSQQAANDGSDNDPMSKMSGYQLSQHIGQASSLGEMLKYKNALKYKMATEPQMIQRQIQMAQLNHQYNENGEKWLADNIKNSPFAQRLVNGKWETDPQAANDYQQAIGTVADKYKDADGVEQPMSLAHMAGRDKLRAQGMLNRANARYVAGQIANSYGDGTFWKQGPGSSLPNIVGYRRAEVGDVGPGGEKLSDNLLHRLPLMNENGFVLDNGGGQKQFVPYQSMRNHPQWNDIRNELIQQLHESGDHDGANRLANAKS